jgi:hypothetical protein
VPTLLTEGVWVLAARPKVGKSRLALALAVAVANGGYALGKLKVDAGDVLYLCLEDGERRLQTRLDQLLGDEPAPARLTVTTTFPRMDEGGDPQLRAWLTTHPACRLVIVDTLAMVRPPQSSRSANVYAEDYAAITPFVAIARDHPGLAIVIIHHTRKAVADDPLDAVSGSTGLTGAADGVLVMSRDRGNPDATLYIRGRDIAEADYALSNDAASGAWVLAGPAKDVRLGETRAKIAAALATAGPDGVSAKLIAIATGIGYDTVRATLHRMVRDGQAAQPRRGRYTAPRAEPSPATLAVLQ